MAAKYFDAANMPPVPDSFEFSPLGGSTMTDILGNNVLSNCTAAGVAHLIALLTGGGDSPVTITTAETIAFYSLSTGYVDGDPATDQGGNEVTVLTTWRDKGFDGNGLHAIAGFMQIDPSDAVLLKACMYFFGNLYFGLELPDSYSEAPNSVWGPGTPDPLKGHCVVGTGASLTGISVNTWGEPDEFTYPGIADLCSEANGGMVFCVLSKEWVAKASAAAPNGLDLSALIADFDGLGGTVAA
jgi:hypothetical protein